MDDKNVEVKETAGIADDKTDNSPLLMIEGVSKEFTVDKKKTLKAVSEISLSLARGEQVAIVGESGCGKSTLAKLVACMEKVSSGRITFDGDDITGLKGAKLKAYRRQVQMIFQDPSGVFSPRMRVGTFLMEPWINFEHLNRQQAKEKAIESLERVSLSEEYFKKYPHQLSGGELQRVAIARAISLKPKLLICDEATSALDVSIQRSILELLNEYHEETGFSNLLSSHDLALAEDFCDRVAVMYLGRIVEVLEAKALRKNAKHPYTKALLDSVFSIHDPKDKKINVLKGEPPSPIDLPEGCAFRDRCDCRSGQCAETSPELKDLEGVHQVACFEMKH